MPNPSQCSDLYTESERRERARQHYYDTWRIDDMEATDTTPTTRIIEAMPIDDYHAHPALGSSTLKSLDRDGAQLTVLRLSKQIEEPESRALVVGSALHAAVESEEYLHARYVAAPHGRGFGSADSAAFQEMASSIDKTLLTASEMEAVIIQSSAIRPKLATYLSGRRVLSEASLFARLDALGGVEVKCRPDLLVFAPGNGDIDYLEIKTAADISPRGFRSAVFRYGYWLQQAHYERVIRAVYGRHVRTTFVVVSKTRPAVVRFYRIDDLSAAAAERRWEELVEEYRERCGSLDWDDESIREPTTLELGMAQLELDEEEGDGNE